MSRTDQAARRHPQRRAFFRSIRTRFAVCFSLVFVAVLVIVGIFGLVGVPFTSYAGRIAAAKAEAFASLNLIADIKKERLLRWLEERRDDVHVTATSPLVARDVSCVRSTLRERVGSAVRTDTSESTRDGPHGGPYESQVRKERCFTALVQFFKNVHDAYGVYDRIQVADAETGTIILSTDDEKLGADASHLTPFLRALRSGDDYVSDAERGEGGHPVFQIAHVINDEDDRLVAVMLFEIEVDDIIGPMLHRGEGLGRTGEALLVNRRCRVLTSLRHPLPDGTAARPLEYRIEAQPAVLAAGGREGIIEAEDYRGEPVLAAYRHIRVSPEFGWGMVVKRDKADLFAPMREDVIYTALTGLFGIVAVVALTRILVRRLTGPIVSLGRTAERVADGDLKARASVGASDEVGTLAATFNSMIARIQNWRRDLEEQVTTRTAELKQTNVKLETEIIEHKRVEEELRQYEHMVLSVSDMVALVDQRYVYLAANAAYLQAFAKAADEVIGRTVAEVFGEEFFSRVIRSRAERCLAGEDIRYQDWFEFPAAGRKHMDVAYSPYLGPDTEVQGFIVTARDITDRKRAEDALQESRAFLQTVIDAVPESMMVIDRDHRVLLANRAARETSGKDPVRGHLKCHQVSHRRRTPCRGLNEVCPLDEVVETRAPVVAEHIHRDAQSNKIFVEVSAAPILDEAGEVVQVIETARDVTPRKRAEEEVRTAQEQLLEQQHTETERVQVELGKARERLIAQTRLASLGQVVASIAHELRNPLGAARNAVYYLKRYVTRPEPELIENLNIIDQEINTADRIITDLMSVTRSKPPVRETLDLRQVVNEVVERARLGDGIRCRVTLNPDPLTLDADPGQMRQVIGNLLTNAAQAMEGNGEIAIEAKREATCCEIEVRDNGCGVPPEHRDRLFEPLFTTRAKGTGLGLTICREIIERHGGSIELVDQVQPGASFRIRLPR